MIDKQDWLEHGPRGCQSCKRLAPRSCGAYAQMYRKGGAGVRRAFSLDSALGVVLAAEEQVLALC